MAHLCVSNPPYDDGMPRASHHRESLFSIAPLDVNCHGAVPPVGSLRHEEQDSGAWELVPVSSTNSLTQQYKLKKIPKGDFQSFLPRHPFSLFLQGMHKRDVQGFKNEASTNFEDLVSLKMQNASSTPM